jgi:hypothetical protein
MGIGYPIFLIFEQLDPLHQAGIVFDELVCVPIAPEENFLKLTQWQRGSGL